MISFNADYSVKIIAHDISCEITILEGLTNIFMPNTIMCKADNVALPTPQRQA